MAHRVRRPSPPGEQRAAWRTRRWVSTSPLLVLATLALSAGCGFRSPPIGDLVETSSSDGTGGDDDADTETTGNDEGPTTTAPGDDGGTNCPAGPGIEFGHCSNPIPLSDNGQPVTGSLGPCKPDASSGWCGGAGNEVVYSLHLPYSRDVTVTVDSDGFMPMVRVVEKPWDVGEADGFACKANDELSHRVCGPVSRIRKSYAFFAGKDTTYYIVVDSEDAKSAGDYTLTATIGPSEETMNCASRVDDQVYLDGESPYAIKTELGEGQGHMATWCGGAGTEHIYEVQAGEDGAMNVFVRSGEDISPQISVQTTCDTQTVLSVGKACNQWGHESTSLESPVWLNQGESVYVIIDQQSVRGGTYELLIEMD